MQGRGAVVGGLVGMHGTSLFHSQAARRRGPGKGGGTHVRKRARRMGTGRTTPTPPHKSAAAPVARCWWGRATQRRRRLPPPWPDDVPAPPAAERLPAGRDTAGAGAASRLAW